MREHYRIKPGQRVYFAKPVGMDGPIKIGCSSEPARRLVSLMSWCPFPLEIMVSVPGGYQLERDLHDCFAEAYRHNEWFEPIPALLEAIGLLQAGEPIESVVELGASRGALSAVKRRRGKGRWSDERRLKVSYAARLSAARRKLGTKLAVPADVTRIMRRWTCYGNMVPVTPSHSEMSRLEEFLADPHKHAEPVEVRVAA